MLKKNKRVLAVGVLVALGIGSYQLFEPVAAPAAQATNAATPVGVAQVTERVVTEWSDFSGRIEAIEHVQIRPRVDGTIDAVHFQEGQVVKKGAPLFTIDPRPYQAVLAKAEAARDSAKARLALGTAASTGRSFHTFHPNSNRPRRSTSPFAACRCQPGCPGGLKHRSPAG